MGPPIIKRGSFWIFKKSLLANGRAQANLDRVNVQVGGPLYTPGGRSRLILLWGLAGKRQATFLDIQKITARKRKGGGRPRPGECLNWGPLYTPAGKSRLEPGKSQHLIMWPPLIKRGHFLI